MNKRRLSATGATECSNKRINVSNGNLRAICETIACLKVDGINDYDVIRRSTNIIDDLNETHYMALATRSEAFLKRGKLCNAIEDASEMIRIKPMSAQGYLLAGELLIMQGRQLAAIRVLDDGLAVLSVSDRQLLIERREAARRSSVIKMDFVTTLPHEITTKIFKLLSYVNENTLYNSTLVSKHWRTSILSMPDLWNDASNSDKPNAAFRLLPSISRYLKVLDIGSYTKNLGQKLSILAKDRMLTSLTTLSFEYDDDTYKNTYIPLLMLLGEQLEDLTIDGQRSSAPESPVFLDVILSSCVNLKRLVLLIRDSDIEYEVTNKSHSSPLQLEMLFLEARNENRLLENLLPQCPRLRVLYMTPDRPILLQNILQYCPCLQILSINDRNNSYATAFPTLDKYEYGQQLLGLKRLVYKLAEVDDGSPNLHDLVPLITKSKDTLEHLVLYMGPNDIVGMQQAYWESLAAGLYPKLRFADIAWFDETERQAGAGISRMLRGCRSLESLRIGVERNVRISDDFFTSLTASSQLSSLTIYFLTELLGGLNQLFRHHANSNMPSTLKNVTLYQCSAMNDDSLYSIASLPALVELTIIGPLLLVTREGMNNFLEKLGHTRSLLSLTLVEMNYLDSDHVHKLEEMTGLERSMFVSRLDVTNSGEMYSCSTTRLKKAPLDI